MTMLARMTGRMSRGDRRVWAQPTTLPELGELTAQWLEGRIESQPGYAAGYGPDGETRDLIPTLAALNRSGFVTDSSQPGLAGDGQDGSRWEQRAAVSGYTDEPTADAIAHALGGSRFEVFWSASKRGLFRIDSGVVVTTRDGEPFTVFGRQMGRRDIAFQYEECSRDMLAVLYGAVQVTVFDPEWGSNDLWLALDRWAA